MLCGPNISTLARFADLHLDTSFCVDLTFLDSVLSQPHQSHHQTTLPLHKLGYFSCVEVEREVVQSGQKGFLCPVPYVSVSYYLNVGKKRADMTMYEKDPILVALLL